MYWGENTLLVAMSSSTMRVKKATVVREVHPPAKKRYRAQPKANTSIPAVATVLHMMAVSTPGPEISKLLDGA